jgi:preprotein translocase subunit SecY
MFLMWLGEQITERGIGNGISMIILRRHHCRLAGCDRWLVRTGERTGAMHPFTALFICILVVLRDGFRRVRRAWPAQDPGELREAAVREQGVCRPKLQHLPLKINMSGVIPPIFASSIILFPATLRAVVRFLGGHRTGCSDIASTLSPGQPIYVMLYAVRSCSSASSTRRWCSMPAKRRTT